MLGLNNYNGSYPKNIITKLAISRNLKLARLEIGTCALGRNWTAVSRAKTMRVMYWPRHHLPFYNILGWELPAKWVNQNFLSMPTTHGVLRLKPMPCSTRSCHASLSLSLLLLLSMELPFVRPDWLSPPVPRQCLIGGLLLPTPA